MVDKIAKKKISAYEFAEEIKKCFLKRVKIRN